MMGTVLRSLCLWLCLTTGMGLQAMTLERDGDTLFASGPLEGEDFLRFREQIEQGGVKRLVLVDSPGGDIWTALRVGEMVLSAGWETVAVGRCLSACTLLFVAGKTRAFGTGRHPGRTLLGIHGPHDPDTKAVSHRSSPAMYAFYQRRLGAAMDEQVMNEAIYRIQDASGFLLVPEIERNPQKKRLARFCPSLKVSHGACTVREGKDALSLGLVTQASTVPVTLPPSLAGQLSLMGQPIDAPAANAEALVDALRLFICGTGPCKGGDDFLSQWALMPDHRAVAVSRETAGVRLFMAAAGDNDSPDAAMIRALYRCNHQVQRVELCELAALDDHLLHALTQTWLEASRLAISRIPAPAASAVRGEQEDFCKAREVSAMRTVEQGYDTPSPCSLRDALRTDSAQLATALQADEPPLLVDVAPDAHMLPGAVALWNAGLSFADASVERAYHQRFEALLWAAAPDFEQPLIFYGGTGGGWLSANAALRAWQAGYTQVRWYRGGLPAWQAAGLPTVRKVVQGVVH
jgi:rhodanese-related sulfurtransferase